VKLTTKFCKNILENRVSDNMKKHACKVNQSRLPRANKSSGVAFFLAKKLKNLRSYISKTKAINDVK